MTIRKMPEAKAFQRPTNYQHDASSSAMQKWSAAPIAAGDDDKGAATINVLDYIGENWDGTGVTSKRISAALRSIGNREVTVRINSPGGDMFEGITIYNMLRAHSAKVIVEIVGIAASAASVIAMAGDEVKMGLGTFIMIHNAWGICVGDEHDFKSAADLFHEFDAALADIYEARTGLKRAEIVRMMDDETFLGPTTAIEKKFADMQADELSADAAAAIVASDVKNEGTNRAIFARRTIEAALAKAGFSRDQRGDLLVEAAATIPNAARDAGGSDTEAARDAGRSVAALQQLLETIRS